MVGVALKWENRRGGDRTSSRRQGGRIIRDRELNGEQKVRLREQSKRKKLGGKREGGVQGKSPSGSGGGKPKKSITATKKRRIGATVREQKGEKTGENRAKLSE